MWGYGKGSLYCRVQWAPVKKPFPPGGHRASTHVGIREKGFPLRQRKLQYWTASNQGRRCCFCWFLPFASGVEPLARRTVLEVGVESWCTFSLCFLFASTSVVGVKVSILEQDKKEHNEKCHYKLSWNLSRDKFYCGRDAYWGTCLLELPKQFFKN